jgi:hypothetical protein
MLAAALFDRIDALGLQEAIVHLSAHAVRHGLAAVLPAELVLPICGRGERSGGHTFQLTYAIVPEAGLLVEVA